MARCFFCNRNVNAKNKYLFRCGHCSCLNKYDPLTGQIQADEPAMHDQNLNQQSYASSSTHSLPSTFQANPFCHTCSTNQMLLTNLLANYLPDPSSPDYHKRLRDMSQYEESLHLRYPPVCPNCAPAVEEEIERKNQMARSYALGSFLKKSERHRPRSRGPPPKKNTELRWWRIRGCLWFCSLLVALLVSLIGSLGRQSPPYTIPPARALLPLVILSILWTTWDPTFSTIRMARLHGRNLRVKGKKPYVIFQLLAWGSRVATTIFYLLKPVVLNRRYFQVSLCLEIVLLIASKIAIRIPQPPQIRLLDSHKHVSSRSPSLAPGASPPPEPIVAAPAEEVFSGLSLSSKPVVSTAINPIFGVSSFPTAPSTPVAQADDTMDWSPTGPQSEGLRNRRYPRTGDSSDEEPEQPILRTQRFFPPEQPTGLESLLASTLLDDTAQHPPASTSTKWWKWGS